MRGVLNPHFRRLKGTKRRMDEYPAIRAFLSKTRRYPDSLTLGAGYADRFEEFLSDHPDFPDESLSGLVAYPLARRSMDYLYDECEAQHELPGKQTKTGQTYPSDHAQRPEAWPTIHRTLLWRLQYAGTRG